MAKTLVIVPAFNESGRIRSIIEEIERSLPKTDILVVNDCSTDDTGQIASSTGHRVANLSNNLRIGGAVQTGVMYAKENGYDLALQIDSDGQHDPAYAKDLIQLVSSGQADIAICSRYLENSKYSTTLTRSMGVKFFSHLASLITGVKITDATSGFRCFNRKVMEVFSNDYPADFPDADVLIMLSLRGLKIKEIPAQMRPRKHGKSSLTSIRTIYYPFKVMLSVTTTLFREWSNRGVYHDKGA